MEKLIVKELSSEELQNISGGSELSDFVCSVLWAMFATPGIMARRGAAGHEIMGSK